MAPTEASGFSDPDVTRVPEPLPLVVLAGSDPREGSVPRGMQSGDMLTGFKGMLRLPDGRVLVAALIDEYRRSGCFRDPVLIGPARVYADESLPCEIVDCEGGIAESLQAAVQVIESRFGAATPVAVTTCDVVPTAQELRELLATHYESVSDCGFWGLLVEAQSGQMGASSWKPRYRFARPGEQAPLEFYPGHLVIVRVAALKVAVTIALVRLAYHYRNRPLLQRLPGMLGHGIATLMRHDLHRLLRWQWSAETVNVPWQCLRAYFRYRRGLLDVSGFERAFVKTFIRPGYRRASAGPAVRFAVSGTLSLAKDLDTKAEFTELVRARSCDSD